MLMMWIICSLINLTVLAVACKNHRYSLFWPGVAFMAVWFVTLAPLVTAIAVLDRAIFLLEWYRDNKCLRG